mmetsp:Transcript_12498/g.37715  ORF Transcript_12498/g.37715 Transcript_12498/m.37715 type:complete len:262 (-) Transcript_12498:280-1065(-)
MAVSTNCAVGVGRKTQGGAEVVDVERELEGDVGRDAHAADDGIVDEDGALRDGFLGLPLGGEAEETPIAAAQMVVHDVAEPAELVQHPQRRLLLLLRRHGKPKHQDPALVLLPLRRRPRVVLRRRGVGRLSGAAVDVRRCSRRKQRLLLLLLCLHEAPRRRRQRRERRRRGSRSSKGVGAARARVDDVAAVERRVLRVCSDGLVLEAVGHFVPERGRRRRRAEAATGAAAVVATAPRVPARRRLRRVTRRRVLVAKVPPLS